MLINRNFRLHLLFALLAFLPSMVLIGLYWSDSMQADEWLGGGSRAGLLCGVFAGLIIAFEMLLWPRKALRRLRLGPTRYWMAAHIWFGLASLPLAIFHCGFHLGGLLPTTFMVVFVLTILSGVYGLAMQNFLPGWMLRNLPYETIYSQIDYVSEQTVNDARRLLNKACGRDVNQTTGEDEGRVGLQEALEMADDMEAARSATVVVGAVRQAGRTSGRTFETRQVPNAREDGAALWNAFREIKPFLLRGKDVSSPVTDRPKSVLWFQRLRSACNETAVPVIDSLEQMCDQRRQFDAQQTVHRWLHNWIPIHIGLSVAVSVLLAAHIFTALKYW